MRMPILAILATTAIWADLPAIIDRNLLFGDPEIAAAQLSPDGKFLAFVKPLDGTRNVWVKRLAEPFASAKPVTAETKRPVAGYFWSRDGKFILFVKDDGGDENFNVWAVNPADEPKSGAKVPAARNLTDAKKVQAQIVHTSKIDPDVIFVGINDRDKAWHDVYKVKISTGERTLVKKNTEKIAGWDFDNKDQLRLAGRSLDNGDQEILRVDGDKFTRIGSCTVFETCGTLRFHKDGKRVYGLSNAGDANDLTKLTLIDVETGKEEVVESDPLKRVDLTAANFSEVSDELESTTYIDEKRRLYWHDKASEKDFKWLEAKFPGKQVGRASRTLDEQVWLVSVNADNEPGEVYVFERKSKKLSLQYRVRETLNRESLAEMKPIRYKSSDGLEIPAYLTLPKGIAAKNLPVVLMPHGGPWARDFWGFNPYHQFLANRGYAVLSMNFRGSTGYGKKFLNAGNNEWGQKMQDDITWGVKHLVAEGVADPKRVAIMGGSYGGYATLAGVAFTPDVYAAAVAIVAPSNLVSLLETIPPYWEAGRVTMYKRMGDPRTPEGKAQMMRQSPLNSANKIKTPLMVVQGANDPRVNKAESDQIVIALRDRNFPVKYLVAPDEGHGFAKPINNLAMIASSERFFEQYLGGRSQKEIPEDVAKKLDEMTVDPKTVKLAAKVEISQANEAKPDRGLPAGVYSYATTLEMGAQKMNMDIVTEIKEDGGKWIVTDKINTPMGEMSDWAELDKGSLAIRKRKVAQGPVAIDLTATDAKITGTMGMNGQNKPIDADAGGALFAETGAGFSVGALPLAEGYQAAFRNFDLQKMKPKNMTLAVVGVESVTVPAGTFEAFKVDVKSDDGGNDLMTVWIDKKSRKLLKTTAVLAQMGGAKMTSELK